MQKSQRREGSSREFKEEQRVKEEELSLRTVNSVHPGI
jgi:hypothetical protein